MENIPIEFFHALDWVVIQANLSETWPWDRRSRRHLRARRTDRSLARRAWRHVQRHHTDHAPATHG